MEPLSTTFSDFTATEIYRIYVLFISTYSCFIFNLTIFLLTANEASTDPVFQVLTGVDPRVQIYIYFYQYNSRILCAHRDYSSFQAKQIVHLGK